MKYDSALLKLGLQHVASVPLLFAKFHGSGVVVLIVIKIVDDFLASGPEGLLRSFLTSIGDTFKLDSVCHGPGKFRFYGMSITQHDDPSVTIDAAAKMEAIEGYPVTSVLLRQINEPINAPEKRAFMSVNASLNWLGATSSLLCAYYASHLQQEMSSPNVDALISHINKLSLLKRYGTVSHYPCTSKNAQTKIVTFSDASRTTDGS